MTDACDCRFASDFDGPFPVDRVRLTSIYSKGDGVVRWQAALVPYAACVEVTGKPRRADLQPQDLPGDRDALADPELTLEPELEDTDAHRP